MAPRLVRLLLADRAGEPGAPTPTRERSVDTITSSFIDPAAKILNAVVRPDVVVQCRKLDQLAEECDSTIYAHVLVANDGLRDSLGLISAAAEDLEHLHGLDSSVDVKRHPGRGEISLCCADVQKACQRPGRR